MAAADKASVGFVGLGAMGFGMAAHLVTLGHTVKGFDVFAASVDRFKAAGGLAASSLADSAAGVAFYVCMVASADQAQAALFGEPDSIVSALPQGATLLLCSTVPSSYARSVPASLAAVGRGDVHFVDAPVSGGAKRAADGMLAIMAAGSDAAIHRARPLLQALSDPAGLFIVQGGVGAGSNMKMVHQVLAAIHILLASEAMAFAARLGLDATWVFDRVIKSDAWFWMYEHRVPRMLTADYFPGVSALTIILKDAGIVTSTARLVNYPTPLCSAAEQVYLFGLAQGFGSHDDAGMVRVYHPESVAKLHPQLDGNAAESRQEKLDLVLNILRGVELCAAAEAIGFARYLDLDLHQFHRLASDAAGGSVIFRERGAEMIELVTGEALVDANTLQPLDVERVRKDLSEAVRQARQVNCPMPLAGGALNLLVAAQRRTGGEKGNNYFGLLQ